MLTFVSRLACKRVCKRGLMAWGGWSSLVAVQRCVHLGTDALGSCVAALEDPYDKDEPNSRVFGSGTAAVLCMFRCRPWPLAYKMITAAGRGSSNLVNAAGS